MFSTKPRFTCTHPGCGASYVRKEHLVRHADQHSQTRQYKCNDCGMAFSRSDSLRRHMRLHSATRVDDPVDRVARACDLCHALKCRCDRNNPCAACARRGRRCTFDRFTNENVAVTRSSSVVSGYGTDTQSQGKRRRVDTDTSYLDINLATINPISSAAAAVVVSKDDVSEDHLRTALRQQESQIRNTLTNVSDYQQQQQRQRPSLRLSDVFILSNNFVNNNVTVDTEMDAYMTTIDVQYYVDLFFEYVYPRWPFVYRASFRAESEQPILVLAVVMFGLWITEEARLMRLAWMIRARLLAIFEAQMENWAVHDISSTRTSRWPIVTYQAILLFVIFCLTAHNSAGDEFDDEIDKNDGNENDIHRIHTIFTHLVHTCRAQGVLYYPAMLAQISIDDPIVFKFTNAEEFKYFALTLFKVDHLLSQLMLLDSDPEEENQQQEEKEENKNNRLSISDLQFPLPDSGYLHESPSIREFLRRRERQARDPSVSSARKSAIVADDRRMMLDRDKNPWICDILSSSSSSSTTQVGDVEQRKKRRKAWLSLGFWLGYLGGLDPVFT